MSTTNIEALLRHIKHIHNNLFQTEVFKKAAEQAGDKMQSEVISSLKSNSTGYSYRQSSALRTTLNTQTADFIVGRSSVKIGFGFIDDLNMTTKRRAQSAVFPGNEKPIRLRPEPDLPSWIIMEFGRKGTGGKAGSVPSFIKKEISYSPRDSKTLMFGPSESHHNSKPIMFMTNKKIMEEHGNKTAKSLTKHPGIREGRFFRDGLKSAQPSVQTILGKGIEESLRFLTK